MKIEMTIPIIPKAQARTTAFYNKATGRAGVFKKASQRAEEVALIALIEKYRPERPFEGALSLKVTAFRPIPPSWSKKKQEEARRLLIFPTGKPDLDNFVKHVKDCLTKLSFWRDDSQVVALTASKVYGDFPCWDISIEEYLK